MAVVVARERPQLADQPAEHELAGLGGHHRGWPSTPLLAAELLVGRGRKTDRGADTPGERPPAAGESQPV
jgi:hypothetical protein